MSEENEQLEYEEEEEEQEEEGEEEEPDDDGMCQKVSAFSYHFMHMTVFLLHHIRRR